MRDARLHVEDAGAVQPAVRRASSGIRSSWPIGQTVSKWPSSRICDVPQPNSAQQVVAALGARAARVTRAAKRLEPRRQLGAAAIDRGLVVVGDSMRDERLDRSRAASRCSARQKSRRAIIGHDMSAEAQWSVHVCLPCFAVALRPLRSLRRGAQPPQRRSRSRAPEPRGHAPPPATPPPPAPQRRHRRTQRPRRGQPEAPPTEAMLGVPIYPGAQFIASYDAGRGQRFYLFGIDRVVRRARRLLPDGAEAEGRAGLRRAGRPTSSTSAGSRGDDGVSAERDDQGLHVGRVAGLSEPEAGRTAGALPDASSRSSRSTGTIESTTVTG